jgi:hypothetical protein
MAMDPANFAISQGNKLPPAAVLFNRMNGVSGIPIRVPRRVGYEQRQAEIQAGATTALPLQKFLPVQKNARSRPARHNHANTTT